MKLSSSKPYAIQAVDVIALALGLVGTVSSIAIFMDSFVPRVVIAISAFFTLSIILLSADRTCSTIGLKERRATLRQGVYKLAIFVVSLVFRWGPYRFEQGGQDQGLYVNMATTLSRWGSVRFPDEFRQSLGAGAQAIYDQTLLSSYYLVDSSKSLMTIEFYPLHPALMALSQYIFGGLGHESLTIISMLGILGAWYLALEIDGRESVACLFALLFAINPALTFFAKFPVSESVALTCVLFGMLYFVRFLRSTGSKQRTLNILISLLSFNSLLYIRWQFLLYIPFFSLVVIAVTVVPSYRHLRNRVVLYVASVFTLFVISMLYYMKKQPELYAPVKDSLLDMFPNFEIRTLVLASVVACMSVVVLIMLTKTERISLSSNALRTPRFERLIPFVLPLVLVLAIPSVLSLYAGQSMYPWGYHVPADVDSWVIRYHAAYRLALFVSPILFVIAIFGSLLSPVRNRATGVLYAFTGLCFTGILMRPNVPYLYYYGRYLVVDVLPGLMLIGVIVLVNWATSSRKLMRLLSFSLTALVVIYSAIFSVVLLGKHEGEDSGFYSELAQQVSRNDVLIVSSTSQQLIVPLRASYQLNIVSVPDQSSGYSLQDIVDTFQPVAREKGGRLLFLTPGQSAPMNFVFLNEFIFTDRYFTNTDHFRGDGLAFLGSRRRLLLPTYWWSYQVDWRLFEVK